MSKLEVIWNFNDNCHAGPFPEIGLENAKVIGPKVVDRASFEAIHGRAGSLSGTKSGIRHASKECWGDSSLKQAAE
jgi:hypothetical protein